MGKFNWFSLFIVMSLTPAVCATNQMMISSQTQSNASSIQSFSWGASSSPITVNVVTKRLKAIESQITTFSANFDQTVKIKDAGLTQNVVGSIDYSKPKRFNIKQLRPEKQRVVSDGKILWVWRPSKNQVLRMKLQDWGERQPFAQGLIDFGHYAEMIGNYHVKIVKTTPLLGALKGYQEITLLLTPRQGDNKFSLRLKLNTRNFFPFESDFKQNGVFVRSRFSDIVYNISLSSSEFHFDPPADAQVFDGGI